jgi:hypothetical protein
MWTSQRCISRARRSTSAVLARASPAPRAIDAIQRIPYAHATAFSSRHVLSSAEAYAVESKSNVVHHKRSAIAHNCRGRRNMHVIGVGGRWPRATAAASLGTHNKPACVIGLHQLLTIQKCPRRPQAARASTRVAADSSLTAAASTCRNTRPAINYKGLSPRALNLFVTIG